MRHKSLKERVLETFREYGGWWKVEGMAGWLNVDTEKVLEVWEGLEFEGLMERKPRRR